MIFMDPPNQKILFKHKIGIIPQHKPLNALSIGILAYLLLIWTHATKVLEEHHFKMTKLTFSHFRNLRMNTS